MLSNKKSSRIAKILPQFSTYSGNKPLLDLLEIQRKSFFDLLEYGIAHELSQIATFRETAKDSVSTRELELVFNPETYKLVSPNCTPKQAILKGKTYACKLYVQATLTIRSAPHRSGRETDSNPLLSNAQNNESSNTFAKRKEKKFVDKARYPETVRTYPAAFFDSYQPVQRSVGVMKKSPADFLFYSHYRRLKKNKNRGLFQLLKDSEYFFPKHSTSNAPKEQNVKLPCKPEGVRPTQKGNNGPEGIFNEYPFLLQSSPLPRRGTRSVLSKRKKVKKNWCTLLKENVPKDPRNFSDQLLDSLHLKNLSDIKIRKLLTPTLLYPYTPLGFQVKERKVGNKSTNVGDLWSPSNLKSKYFQFFTNLGKEKNSLENAFILASLEKEIFEKVKENRLNIALSQDASLKTYTSGQTFGFAKQKKETKLLRRDQNNSPHFLPQRGIASLQILNPKGSKGKTKPIKLGDTKPAINLIPPRAFEADDKLSLFYISDSQILPYPTTFINSFQLAQEGAVKGDTNKFNIPVDLNFLKNALSGSIPLRYAKLKSLGQSFRPRKSLLMLNTPNLITSKRLGVMSCLAIKRGIHPLPQRGTNLRCPEGLYPFDALQPKGRFEQPEIARLGLRSTKKICFVSNNKMLDLNKTFSLFQKEPKDLLNNEGLHLPQTVYTSFLPKQSQYASLDHVASFSCKATRDPKRAGGFLRRLALKGYFRSNLQGFRQVDSRSLLPKRARYMFGKPEGEPEQLHYNAPLWGRKQSLIAPLTLKRNPLSDFFLKRPFYASQPKGYKSSWSISDAEKQSPHLDQPLIYESFESDANQLIQRGNELAALPLGTSSHPKGYFWCNEETTRKSLENFLLQYRTFSFNNWSKKRRSVMRFAEFSFPFVIPIYPDVIQHSGLASPLQKKSPKWFDLILTNDESKKLQHQAFLNTFSDSMTLLPQGVQPLVARKAPSGQRALNYVQAFGVKGIAIKGKESFDKVYQEPLHYKISRRETTIGIRTLARLTKNRNIKESFNLLSFLNKINGTRNYWEYPWRKVSQFDTNLKQDLVSKNLNFFLHFFFVPVTPKGLTGKRQPQYASLDPIVSSYPKGMYASQDLEQPAVAIYSGLQNRISLANLSKHNKATSLLFRERKGYKKVVFNTFREAPSTLRYAKEHTSLWMQPKVAPPYVSQLKEVYAFIERIQFGIDPVGIRKEKKLDKDATLQSNPSGYKVISEAEKQLPRTMKFLESNNVNTLVKSLWLPAKLTGKRNYISKVKSVTLFSPTKSVYDFHLRSHTSFVLPKRIRSNQFPPLRKPINLQTLHSASPEERVDVRYPVTPWWYRVQSKVAQDVGQQGQAKRTGVIAKQPSAPLQYRAKEAEKKENIQIFNPWIFLGELPVMTRRGHFILNGSPRVIVNQIARCPGIYFQEKRRGVGFEQEVRVSADIIPQRGPWLRIQSDWEGRFWARLKQEGRVKYATLYGAFQEFEKQYSAPLVSSIITSSTDFPKSEMLAFQEKKAKEDRQKKALVRLFKNSTRYGLGELGRFRINERVHSVSLLQTTNLPSASFLPFEPEGIKAHLTPNGEQPRLLRKPEGLHPKLEQPEVTRHSGSNESKKAEKSRLTLTPSGSEVEKSLQSNPRFLPSKEQGLVDVSRKKLMLLRNDNSAKDSLTLQNKQLVPALPSKTIFRKTALFNFVLPQGGSFFLDSEGVTKRMESTSKLAKTFDRTGFNLRLTSSQLKVPSSAWPIRVKGYEISDSVKNTMVAKSFPSDLSTKLKPKASMTSYALQAQKAKELGAAKQATDSLSFHVGLNDSYRTEGSTAAQEMEKYLLMAKDIDAVHTFLERLLEGQGSTDDIDHLKNRFIRTSGKLLQQQFELGLNRLNEVITPLLKNLIQGTALSSSSTLGNMHVSKDISTVSKKKKPKKLSEKVLSNNQGLHQELLNSERVQGDQGFRQIDNEALDVSPAKQSRGPNKIEAPSGKVAPIKEKRKGKGYESRLFNTAEVITLDKLTLKKAGTSTPSEHESSWVSSQTEKQLPRSPSRDVIGTTSFSGLTPSGLSEISQGVQPPVDQVQGTTFRMPFQGNAKQAEDLRYANEVQGEKETAQKGISNRLDASFGSSALRSTPSYKTVTSPFRWLRTSKPINGAFREFFGSNPLSQYMDQSNPLAEITHKRRLSSMGPGGIKRETAGMEVRGIHPTHYGRICPIETPEGKNAGLVNSPTVYGRVGNKGFMETPLYQVVQSQIQTKRWAFFSAQQEEDEETSLATCDVGLTRFNLLPYVPISVQTANNPLAHFQQVERNRVGYRALSPVQTISIATALIPFLEHDDANRALMGSNMQRQAIPLLLPERPIVGTGFEPIVITESGQALQATTTGYVSHVNANKIILHSIDSVGKTLPQSILRDCAIHFNGVYLAKTAKSVASGASLLCTGQDESRLDERSIAPTSFSYKAAHQPKGISLYSVNPERVRLDKGQAKRTGIVAKQPSGYMVKVERYKKHISVISLLETESVGIVVNQVGTKRIGKYLLHPLVKVIARSEAHGMKVKPEGAYLKNCAASLLPKQPTVVPSFTEQAWLALQPQGLHPELLYPLPQRRVKGHSVYPSGVTQSKSKEAKESPLNALQSLGLVPLRLAKHQEVQGTTISCLGQNNHKFSQHARARLHLCSTHNAFLLKAVEQPLQLYQRSNQETCLSQRPLVQQGDWVQKGDFIADCSASHFGDLALGKNVTVAYMPWEGYNFEDAIVISDRLVADDVYTSIHIERYEIKVSKNSQGKEKITDQIPSLPFRSLDHLDDLGIARVSSWVQPGDILVGKVVELKRPLSPYERLAWELASRLSPTSPEREKWLNKVWLEDVSLRLPPGVCGRVINSQIVSTEWSEKEQIAHPLEVHIYLAVKRKIQVGDKLAGRHGNKGIVSIILPRQDMPYLGDGSSIDMILNPLGVPSRMNLGQIFECLLGLAGSQLGCNFKVTPFDEIAGGEASRSLVFLKLYQCRLLYKQQWLFTPAFPGKCKLFDGRTGEPFENWVTVGRAYMLKLIHMVDHKIHARSTGPYSLFTRQPVRGRSRRGGQRLGEMEVWAVEGFGAAYTLQEFLTIKSDDLKARAALQRSFYKQSDVTLRKVRISPGNPEAFKVLVSELQALCLHIHM